MLPNDIILVRHGESEGNVANRASRKGNNSYFTKEYKEKHSSAWRLSEEGRKQAKAAGDWLKENKLNQFNRYYVSEYARAMETAHLLDLPHNPRWYLDMYLRERDWGDLETCTEEERKERFKDSLRVKTLQPFYWKAPNGESMADLCLRIDRFLGTLHREIDHGSVIIVSHGEVIQGFMMRLERMDYRSFRKYTDSKHPYDYINNGQIIHYTRWNCRTNECYPYMSSVRSICPWDLSRSSNVWRLIKRPALSGEELKNHYENY